MNILLINPNRFQNPPVVPIGLEYIASSLDSLEKHKIDLLDLTFVTEPIEVVQKKIESKSYDIAAISVRNIDDVIFNDNKFYLPEIKALIEIIKTKNIKIIIGGSACDADPQGLFEYLQPNFLIYGPGEVAICDLLSKIERRDLIDPIINGWKYGINKDLRRNPMKYFDYYQYSIRGGIFGFQIQAGCEGKCHFCFEHSKPLMFRNPDAVTNDIIEIARSGHRDFHLSDSEFNQDLSASKNFLKVLQNKLKWAGQSIRWALYMKPKPIDQQLFELLKATGANLITLSCESSKTQQARNGYSLQDIQFFLDLANDYGISIAIDMLTGAPDELMEDLERIIRFFKINRPKRVNINPVFRIYRNTMLFSILQHNLEQEKSKIINYENFEQNPLFPAFYRKFSDSEILELITDDPIFKIEGTEKGVNYQRLI